VVELRAPGLPGSTPGRHVRVHRGLGWSGGRQRQGKSAAQRLTRGGALGKSRPLQVLGSCGEALGSLLASRQGRCATPVGFGSSRAMRRGGAARS
jgi:hypothetical protein